MNICKCAPLIPFHGQEIPQIVEALTNGHSDLTLLFSFFFLGAKNYLADASGGVFSDSDLWGWT
jgi:hypothetical protein